MNKKNVLAGLAVAALTAGCSALPQTRGDGPPAYVNVARTSELTVQLIPQDSAASQPNEHPAAFQPAQLEALLKSLRVAGDDGTQLTLASPSRLEQLAADMSKGFVRAGPDQDVAFSIYRRSGGPVFSSSRKVTSGRAFYRDNTLNLVFGEFDSDFSEFRDLTIKPLGHGSRAGTPGVDMTRLVASDSWHRHDNRGDWIEMPATPEAIEAAAAAAPTAIESSSSGAAQPLRYGPAASTPIQPSAPASKPVAPAAPATTRPAPMPVTAPQSSAEMAAPPSGAEGWSRIEDRLTQLKRLRDKNLISAEDYQSKKDALLEQLP